MQRYGGKQYPIELFAQSVSHAKKEIKKGAIEDLKLDGDKLTLWGHVFVFPVDEWPTERDERLKKAWGEIKQFLDVKRSPW